VNYRWNNNIAFKAYLFAGQDGVGLEYQNNDAAATLIGASDSNLRFLWDNFNTFFFTSLLVNPKENMLLKTTAGGGITSSLYEYTENRSFTTSLITSKTIDNYYFDIYNAELREDFDWKLNDNLLLSFGAEGIFKKWNTKYDNNLILEIDMGGNYQQVDYILPNLSNNAFFSALWALAEWSSPSKKIDIEAGFRVQHVFFYDDTSSFTSFPDINPRLSASFTVFEGKENIVSNFSINAGSALFSAINDEIAMADLDTGLKELKTVSSWISTLGALLGFKDGTELSIEGYYKYVFNRAYSKLGGEYYLTPDGAPSVSDVYYFDGASHIFGFDLLLRHDIGKKLTGWLAYSFNFAKYHDGNANKTPYGAYFSPDDGWYYPLFHRFHTLNLVINYAITKKYNLYLRSGFVSGAPDTDKSIYSYILTLPDGSTLDKFGLYESYSDFKRKIFKLPLDIKLSYKFFNKAGKTQGEVYFAIENTLVLVLPHDSGKVLNAYTGKMESSANGAIYDLPIPMLSFGIKWTY
jgi:hypothetical protein